MRFETLLCAIVFLADLSASARADLRSSAMPQFSATDQRIIERNELLRTIVDGDPWLARRILDLLVNTRCDRPLEGFDVTKNPDLVGASCADGSVEWLEMMKRARAEKDARLKEGVGNSSRTAEGSVELIEMMKKAKDAKESGTR